MKRYGIVLSLVPLIFIGGCATIRVTDPPRTATEQFLLSVAATNAVAGISAEAISAEALRDRRVFVDSTYLTNTGNTDTWYMVGELRAKLLLAGVRLINTREQAQIIVELRSGGLGIDRLEFLLGIPAIYVSNVTSTAGIPLATPELAIIKNTRQRAVASIAFVAYWADSGEVIASSGPHIGRSFREDYWIFGTGPRTVGDIPPTERAK